MRKFTRIGRSEGRHCRQPTRIVALKSRVISACEARMPALAATDCPWSSLSLYHALGTYKPWFRFFSIGKNLWYPLIGLLVELQVVLTSPRLLVPSSLRGLEKKQLQDVDMRLMWALLLLSLAQVHHWIYDRKSTTWAKNRKNRKRNKV